MKRILLKTVATSLALALIFSIGSFIFIAGAETDLSDVPEGYTPIYTASEFNNIRNDLVGKYILMDDIDLSSYHNWEPIGSSETPFTGELDGNGKCILNMQIYGEYTHEDSLYFALFASMKKSVVKNLNIINASIDVKFTGTVSDTFRAGALAGYANTVTVENCIASGNIKIEGFAKGAVGGLFGKENYSFPQNCINYADIKVITDENLYDISIGGFSGISTTESINYCSNYGDITVSGNNGQDNYGTLHVGGLVGDGESNGCAFYNCFNRGDISLDFSTTSTYVGGIIGECFVAERCYNTGEIDVPENFKGFIGGIAGDMWNGGLAIPPSPHITDVYYINEGLYPSYAGGSAPDDDDFENAKLLTEEDFKKQESFVGFNFDTVWEMEENGYPVLQSQPETPQGAIASGACGENVNYIFNWVTGELCIFGTGDMDNYDSASIFEGFFWAPWYRERKHVKTVVIDEGVTSIGDCAFDGCENMKSVDIPSSVKAIGWAAFSYCRSIECIVIPEGVETIGHEAFYECVGLKTVSIPKSVTSLGDDCFYYCVSLENITTDNENPSYSSDEYGVLFNKDKTDLILYPSGNERTNYTIPESVVKIYSFSFSQSKNLKNITFSNNLKSIGMEAFSHCEGLTELTLPGSLEQINSLSFYYCTNLKSVIIPEGVKTIGSNAFLHCEALESIILPNSLERINMNAFDSTAFFENEENWDNDSLYCGKYLLAVKEDYTGKLVITPGTRMIADFAVNRCKNITEVTIPDSMIIIGEGAFNMCAGLKSVTLPSSVTALLGSTFRFCDSLVSMTIPETVTTIGNQVFYQCENLESVEIKAKVSTIGRSMFSGCPKLTSVKLPDTITTIDKAAFRECDSIETIVLPEGVEVIADQGFAWSPKLTNVNLPESLTTIGIEAFYGTNINNITISENVSAIEEKAFANTANLSNFAVDENNSSFVYDGKALYTKDKSRLLCYFISNNDTIYVISDEVTQIDGEAFSGNTHLERITIPDGVTQMGGSAFGNCSNLKSVAIGSGISPLNTYSFRNCTPLEKVYISDSMKEIILYAFSGCDNIKDVYYSGTQEEWSQIKNLSRVSEFKNATIHYSHTHSHSLDSESNETYAKYGYRLYSCVCGHYYSEYDLVSKSDKYDVMAIYSPDCFSEEIILEVETVTSDREPGGIYMVDGKTYIQVGVYNLKAVNGNGDVVQPNEGHTVKIKMSIPDEYKDKTDIVIYHRFVDGGREKLSTSDGTLAIENGYMIFEVSKFSEFEILAGTADMTVSKLPAKLNYSYKGTLDLSGIELKITDIDGSVEYVTDTSKMTVEGFDSSKLGTQTVTVKYEQYSCTFEVTVSYTWWQWIIRILLLGFLWY